MASSARIDELRKKFDENPRRYFAPLANEYRKAGDLEQAIFICQEYLPQQPGHMSGHIVYGQALFEQNRHDEAKTVFETALSLDPENLIALRHLGDIARSTGDTLEARKWYQRVLEADPRNEEIAQLMLSLLAPPLGPATTTPPAAGPSVDHNAPTPLTNPAVGRVPLTGADQSLGVEKAPDMALGGAAPLAIPDPAEAAQTPRKSVELDPRDFVSRHAPKEEELLDLDSFDLGGVPLSTLRGSNDAPAAVEEPAPAMDEQSSDDVFSEGLSFESLSPAAAPTPEPQPEPLSFTPTSPAVENPIGGDVSIGAGEHLVELDAPFEADPFAIAASQPADVEFEEPSAALAQGPEIELAQDVSLGLPDDGVSSGFVDGGESLDGLESFEAGILPNAPRDTLSIDAGSFYDIPEPEPSVAPQVEAQAQAQAESVAEDLAAEFVEEVAGTASETSGAFATETMATLYLQQGHLESALDIYRQLVDQRPDDGGLQARMLAVEAQLDAQLDAQRAAEEAERVAQSEASEPSQHASETLAPRSYGGPTIREFLSGLMTRRATSVESPVDASIEPQADDALDTPVDVPLSQEPVAHADAPIFVEPEMPLTPEQVAFHSAETPLSNPRVEPAADLRPTPSSTDTVGGSLDMLFSGADAAAQDSQAARALADAFAPDTPDTAPLQGMPAHRASSELSLNHVFKGSTPQRNSSETNAFSFDQFFTDGAAAPQAAPEAEGSAAPPAEGADDIAQFNAWLNGLKKT